MPRSPRMIYITSVNADEEEAVRAAIMETRMRLLGAPELQIVDDAHGHRVWVPEETVDTFIDAAIDAGAEDVAARIYSASR